MKHIPPVLLAEDDGNDVFFMQRAFKMAQIDNPLIVVPNGQEAVWYLTGQKTYTDRELYPEPCLVVLDLKMPLMDGFDVLAWVKEHSPFDKSVPPLIVLSSSGCQSDMEKAMLLGAQEYLLKPSTLTDLVTLMRDLKTRRL